MATFVLVHGAFGGGWIWRRVERLLVGRGHKVFCPTLTGVGERSHLATSAVTLTTHITDIANLLRWEELTNIVLCGHSYGGMVISGVTERVAPGTIGSIVYLDAVLAEDGHSLLDCAGAAGKAYFKVDPATDMMLPPPIEFLRLAGDDLDLVARHRTPQPAGTFCEPLRVGDALERIPLKAFVLATGHDGPEFLRQCAARVRQRPTWRSYEIPCGHEVMLEMPEQLAGILEESIPS